jgi:hypothetical protein
MREFEEQIKNLFRQQNCKPGHVILMQTVRCILLDRLNHVEREECENTIKSLIEDGFCTYDNQGLECLRLTEQGYNGLYPRRSDDQLEELIFNLFRQNDCKAGQGFMERQLRNLEQTLNPEDAKGLIDAMNRLIKDGDIIYKVESPAFIRLTEKGYKKVYNL